MNQEVNPDIVPDLGTGQGKYTKGEMQAYGRLHQRMNNRIPMHHVEIQKPVYTEQNLKSKNPPPEKRAAALPTNT